MEPTTESEIVLSPTADAGNEEPAPAVPETVEDAVAEEDTSENSAFSILGELADEGDLAEWDASIRPKVALLDEKIDAISMRYLFHGDGQSENDFSELSDRLIYEIKASLEGTISLVEEMDRVDEKVDRAERILEKLLGCTSILDEEWWIWSS